MEQDLSLLKKEEPLLRRSQRSQIEEVERHCPVCGQLLTEIKCKRVCKKCGFFIGCSE